MTVLIHPEVRREDAPPDINDHAVALIEEKIEEWRHLHRALVAADARVLDHRRKQPAAVSRIGFLEADARLLQYKCDRALESLASAVAARRALFRPERPYPPMDF